MEVECSICKDHVRVPVRFRCFPCSNKQNGTSSCNSVLRVCMTCARDYLQLNEPRNNRDRWKKCLVCDCETTPVTLNAQMAYEKDFLLMSLDPRKDLDCPYDDCDFQGGQNELDRHLRDDCHHRLKYCHDCRRFYVFQNYEKHMIFCKGWQICGLCEMAVRNRNLTKHLRERHKAIRYRMNAKKNHTICNRHCFSAPMIVLLVACIFVKFFSYFDN